MAKIDFKNVQTMIGNGAVVNGPISLKGGIIIYGTVYGDIQTDGPLRITISGKVFGNVQASDAHIGGSLKGDISVSNKIVLGRKSEIIGDLKTSKHSSAFFFAFSSIVFLSSITSGISSLTIKVCLLPNS